MENLYNYNSILNYLNLHIDSKIIGCAITGSNIINLEDDQSDIDLVVFTYNNNRPYLSNIISFYDPQTDKYIEVLVEDLTELTTRELKDFYGYYSWVNFIKPKQIDYMLSEENKFRYQELKNLNKKFKHFWVYCMLIGYRKSIQKVLEALNTQDFSQLLRKFVKETYQVSYAFCETFSESFDINIFKILKRNQLLTLTEEQQLQLKNILNKLITLNIPAETELQEILCSFKKEVNLIWK